MYEDMSVFEYLRHRLHLRKLGRPTQQELYGQAEEIRQSMQSDIREVSLGRLKLEIFYHGHHVKWLDRSEIQEAEAKKINGAYLASNLEEIHIRPGETRIDYTGILDDQGDWALIELTLYRSQDLVREAAFPIQRYTVRSFKVIRGVTLDELVSKCKGDICHVLDALHRVQESSAASKKETYERHLTKSRWIGNRLRDLKFRGSRIQSV